MSFTLFNGSLECLYQAAVSVAKVPHRPQLAIAIGDQDSYSGLKTWRHSDTEDFAPPDNAVAVLREPVFLSPGVRPRLRLRMKSM